MDMSERPASDLTPCTLVMFLSLMSQSKNAFLPLNGVQGWIRGYPTNEIVYRHPTVPIASAPERGSSAGAVVGHFLRTWAA